VLSVNVQPKQASLWVGDSMRLTASVTMANNLPPPPITWRSSDTAVATVAPSGEVHGVAPGSAYAIATTTATKQDSGALTVVPVPVATVAVTPPTATLLVGTTLQLTATPHDSAGDPLSGRAASWASSDTTVAQVDARGVVTARATGSATITASVEGKTGSATITVVPVPVASVTVTPPSATLLVGTTLQLVATPKDSTGAALPGRVVSWSSGDTAVAKVDDRGLVTAKAPGTTGVTAGVEGKSATATLTIVPVPVASVTIAPTSAAIFVGASLQFTATPKDSTGAPLVGRTVTWSSGNAAVASVSATGLVTGNAAGSTSITASTGGKSATATVAVALVPVASVSVSPPTDSVAVGKSVQLVATTQDTAGNVLTGRVVTWTSANAAIAAVSSTGRVTGAALGTTSISATSEGKTGTAAITVTHPGWYAAPSGTSSGDGGVSAPWDLATALVGGNGKVQPGDTIWLRAGTYPGTFRATLAGTAAAPIIVRPYGTERATIDGGAANLETLTVDGQNAWYWDFEVIQSNTARLGTAGTGSPLRPAGVYVRSATSVKLINLIVHDVGHGVYTENTAHDIEIYGCIIYNGGEENATTGGRSDGHGIYLRNDGIGWKVVRDNVIFDQFGFGIHAYAVTGEGLRNLVLDGNALFNNGTPSNYDNANLLLGGTVPADNDTVSNNMQYFSPGLGFWNARIGFDTLVNGAAVVQNNYLIGGRPTLDVGRWTNLLVQGNTLYGANTLAWPHDTAAPSTERWNGNTHLRDPTALAWQYAHGYYAFAAWATALGAGDQASATPPASPLVFVRPNRYEAGRATIVVYNWPQQASVSVDLSGAVPVGRGYQIRSVQNIFGTPIASGIYGGGSIAIPMGGIAPPAPIGGSFQPLPSTEPFFDAFVVTSTP